MWVELLGIAGTAVSAYMQQQAQKKAAAQNALAEMSKSGQKGASEPTASALMGTNSGEGTSEPQSLLPQSIPQTPQNLTTQQTANDPSKLAMGASSQPDSSDRILDLLARNATNYQPAGYNQAANTVASGLAPYSTVYDQPQVRSSALQTANGGPYDSYQSETYDYSQGKEATQEDDTGNNESTLQMAALAAQVGSSMYQPPPSGGLMYSRGGSNPTVPDARARLQQILAASRRRR